MFDAAPAKDRLAFLDVARGLAAALVVIEHGLEQCLAGYLEWSQAHFNLGKIGVILFLLVSGFIIPVSLEQGGSNARFWLRRFFRLFPLYWLSIALALAYCWLGGSLVVGVPLGNTGDWLVNTTMLQSFLRRPNVWEVYWTLQLELVIYAACSLLFAARLLQHTVWLAAFALVGYLILGLARPLWEGQPFSVGGIRFLYFAPLMGMVAQRYTAGRFGGRTMLIIVAGHALIVLTVWSVSHLLFPEQMTSFVLREISCNWGPAYLIFFTLVAVRFWRMPAWGCWLGRVSYSIYLLHPFILALLLSAECPKWALLPSLASATLLLSAATYHLLEAPSIGWGRSLERRFWSATYSSQIKTSSMRKAA